MSDNNSTLPKKGTVEWLDKVTDAHNKAMKKNNKPKVSGLGLSVEPNATVVKVKKVQPKGKYDDALTAFEKGQSKGFKGDVKKNGVLNAAGQKLGWW